MDKEELRKEIKNTVDDLAGELLYYGRKEDEDLPVGAIEQAMADGVVTRDEILLWFKTAFERNIPKACISPEDVSPHASRVFIDPPKAGQ